MRTDRPIPLVDLARQHARLRGELIAAMERVLDDGRFLDGPCVTELETTFAARHRVAHGVACSSGTAALELALEGCGVGPGGEVIVPTMTFAATAEVVVGRGARPVFVDVLPGSLLMDPSAVAAALTPSTVAVMPVHLYGCPAPMGEIVALAKAHGVTVIEDAAQAHGASLGDRPVGGLGDAAAFSFYPAKNLGALGDAGILLTSSDEIAALARQVRDHGRADKYLHDVVGRNERMDALQAAFLLVKLRHLDAWNVRRRDIAAAYDEALVPLGIRHATPAADASSAHHLYVVEVDRRDEVRAELARHGIATGIHYPVPLHLQRAFRPYAVGQLPVAERAAARILSLPLCPELDDDDVGRVISALRMALAAA